MTTLKDLEQAVNQVNELGKELRSKLYPGRNDDCPLKLDKVHCQNCYFAPNGKCDYDTIIVEHRQSSKIATNYTLKQPLPMPANGCKHI